LSNPPKLSRFGKPTPTIGPRRIGPNKPPPLASSSSLATSSWEAGLSSVSCAAGARRTFAFAVCDCGAVGGIADRWGAAGACESLVKVPVDAARFRAGTAAGGATGSAGASTVGASADGVSAAGACTVGASGRGTSGFAASSVGVGSVAASSAALTLAKKRAASRVPRFTNNRVRSRRKNETRRCCTMPKHNAFRLGENALTRASDAVRGKFGQIRARTRGSASSRPPEEDVGATC